MKCDGCGKFTRSTDLTRQPMTQEDILFRGLDPEYLCPKCAAHLAEGTEA